MLYEAIPMAYIVEEAGGLSSNGSESILDIVPTKLHQRTPIFLGSNEDMNELLDIIAKYKNQGWNIYCTIYFLSFLCKLYR